MLSTGALLFQEAILLCQKETIVFKSNATQVWRAALSLNYPQIPQICNKLLCKCCACQHFHEKYLFPELQVYHAIWSIVLNSFSVWLLSLHIVLSLKSG